MFGKCLACAAKDAVLSRATERELGLVQLIKELQYAIHPARLQNPNVGSGTSQHRDSMGLPITPEVAGVPRLPHGVPRETPPPPYVRTLIRGGHVQPLSAIALRRAADGEAS
jgi:hypothetical protein